MCIKKFFYLLILSLFCNTILANKSANAILFGIANYQIYKSYCDEVDSNIFDIGEYLSLISSAVSGQDVSKKGACLLSEFINFTPIGTIKAGILVASDIPRKNANKWQVCLQSDADGFPKPYTDQQISSLIRLKGDVPTLEKIAEKYDKMCIQKKSDPSDIHFIAQGKCYKDVCAQPYKGYAYVSCAVYTKHCPCLMNLHNANLKSPEYEMDDDGYFIFDDNGLPKIKNEDSLKKYARHCRVSQSARSLFDTKDELPNLFDEACFSYKGHSKANITITSGIVECVEGTFRNIFEKPIIKGFSKISDNTTTSANVFQKDLYALKPYTIYLHKIQNGRHASSFIKALEFPFTSDDKQNIKSLLESIKNLKVTDSCYTCSESGSTSTISNIPLLEKYKIHTSASPCYYHKYCCDDPTLCNKYLQYYENISKLSNDINNVINNINTVLDVDITKVIDEIGLVSTSTTDLSKDPLSLQDRIMQLESVYNQITGQQSSKYVSKSYDLWSNKYTLFNSMRSQIQFLAVIAIAFWTFMLAFRMLTGELTLTSKEIPTMLLNLCLAFFVIFDNNYPNLVVKYVLNISKGISMAMFEIGSTLSASGGTNGNKCIDKFLNQGSQDVIDYKTYVFPSSGKGSTTITSLVCPLGYNIKCDSKNNNKCKAIKCIIDKGVTDENKIECDHNHNEYGVCIAYSANNECIEAQCQYYPEKRIDVSNTSESCLDGSIPNCYSYWHNANLTTSDDIKKYRICVKGLCGAKAYINRPFYEAPYRIVRQYTRDTTGRLLEYASNVAPLCVNKNNNLKYNPALTGDIGYSLELGEYVYTCSKIGYTMAAGFRLQDLIDFGIIEDVETDLMDDFGYLLNNTSSTINDLKEKVIETANSITTVDPVKVLKIDFTNTDSLKNNTGYQRALRVQYLEQRRYKANLNAYYPIINKWGAERDMSYLVLFDTMDCKLFQYLTMGFPEDTIDAIKNMIEGVTQGGLSFKTLAKGYFNFLWFVIVSFPIGLLVAIIFLILAVATLMLIFKATQTYIIAMIGIIITIYLSPLIFLMNLFNTMKSAVEHWKKSLISYVTASFAPFLTLAFAFVIFDIALFGPYWNSLEAQENNLFNANGSINEDCYEDNISKAPLGCLVIRLNDGFVLLRLLKSILSLALGVFGIEPSWLQDNFLETLMYTLYRGFIAVVLMFFGFKMVDKLEDEFKKAVGAGDTKLGFGFEGSASSMIEKGVKVGKKISSVINPYTIIKNTKNYAEKKTIENLKKKNDNNAENRPGSPSKN